MSLIYTSFLNNALKNAIIDAWAFPTNYYLAFTLDVIEIQDASLSVYWVACVPE